MDLSQVQPAPGSSTNPRLHDSRYVIKMRKKGKSLLEEIAPMRLMWWVNHVYWSVQGQVWAQATDRSSDVSSWFSWGPESCDGVIPCMGRNVEVPGVGRPGLARARARGRLPWRRSSS